MFGFNRTLKTCVRFQKERKPTGFMHQEPNTGLILIGGFGSPFPHQPAFPLYIPIFTKLGILHLFPWFSDFGMYGNDPEGL